MKRVLLFVFFLFVFLFFLPLSVQALICVPYGTCHYQSGTGLTCPSSPMGGAAGLNDPFNYCICKKDTVNDECYKFSFNQCSSQDYCNASLDLINDEPYTVTPWGVACPYEYRGNCCNCEGISSNPTSCPSCPKASFQEDGVAKQSLNNVYSFYRDFTAPYSGTLNTLKVRGGVYGGAIRRLVCKVTDSSGGVTLGEVASSSFSGDQADLWITLDFSSLSLSLAADTDYRIYCRGQEAWNSVYWVYDNYPANKTYAVCLCPSAPPSPTPVPTPASSAWFQTEVGNVHSSEDIYNAGLPSGEYFSDKGESNSGPGVVSYDHWLPLEPSDLGEGNLSSTNWLVNTEISSSPYNYNYFYKVLDQPDLIPPPLPNRKIWSSDLPAADGMIAFESSIRMGDNWEIGTKKIVILVQGEFLINARIRIDIDGGGSLVVAARDGIGVSKRIAVNGLNLNTIEGFFFTDGPFYSNVNPSLNLTPANDIKNNRLVIDGGITANEFDFRRNLGEERNQTIPAELFRYNPRLLLNTYPGLWARKHAWEELAP